MPEEQSPSTSICDTCGGILTLLAANIFKLTAPGFVDFFTCDDCGKLTAQDQENDTGQEP